MRHCTPTVRVHMHIDMYCNLSHSTVQWCLYCMHAYSLSCANSSAFKPAAACMTVLVGTLIYLTRHEDMAWYTQRSYPNSRVRLSATESSCSLHNELGDPLLRSIISIWLFHDPETFLRQAISQTFQLSLSHMTRYVWHHDMAHSKKLS